MDPIEALTLGKFMTGLASMESSWYTVELFGEMWADRLAYANENQQEVFKLFFPHPNIGPEVQTNSGFSYELSTFFKCPSLLGSR
jgi:hypothetical protein